MQFRSMKTLVALVAISMMTTGCELIDEELVDDIIDRVNERVNDAESDSGEAVDNEEEAPLPADPGDPACMVDPDACNEEEAPIPAEPDDPACMVDPGACADEGLPDESEEDPVHPEEPEQDECQLALDTCLNETQGDDADLPAPPVEPAANEDAEQQCFEQFDLCIAEQPENEHCPDEPFPPSEGDPSEDPTDHDICDIDLEACIEAWQQEGGDDQEQEAACLESHNECLEAQQSPEDPIEADVWVCDQALNECMEAIEFEQIDEDELAAQEAQCFRRYDECNEMQGPFDDPMAPADGAELACDAPLNDCLNSAEDETDTAQCHEQFEHCMGDHAAVEGEEDTANQDVPPPV